MSTAAALAGLEDVLRALEDANRVLIASCRDLDAEGIDGAMEQRAEVVRHLCSRLAAIPAAERSVLAPRVRQLDEDARLALVEVHATACDQFESARQSSAVRGYATTSAAAVALDRST